jgi:hypothetical protein
MRYGLYVQVQDMLGHARNAKTDRCNSLTVTSLLEAIKSVHVIVT